MKFRLVAAPLALLSLSTFAPAFASQASFDRTLSVSGRVDLSVQTGSGNIHITAGSGSQIVIHGTVHSNWMAGEGQVREIASHPPIEQTGNIVHIGRQNESFHNVSIDYEIQAPANAFLEAHSGSGDITDSGVGENAKLDTGSGNIHATGLRSGFSVGTGSGDIVAEQSGSGDVRAHSGSGSIELRDLRGGLDAHTGSGNIKAAGAPTGTWKLTTGSGNVELSTGSAGFHLNAETGSGTVHSDREMTVQGSMDHHHITGRIGGGGPDVEVHTGSGDIRIH